MLGGGAGVTTGHRGSVIPRRVKEFAPPFLGLLPGAIS